MKWLVLAAVLLPSSCSAGEYSVRYLDFGAGSYATCMNSKGQFAGMTASSVAFFWDPVSGMHEIGTLGGDYSQPTAINDDGQVVGISTTGTGACPPRHPFIWTLAGGIGDLNVGNLTTVNSINDAGQFAGAYEGSQAYAWQGRLKLLATFAAGYSEAFAINNSGQVAGFCNSTQGDPCACLWDQDGLIREYSGDGCGCGLNDSGVMVGWSALGYSNRHAFVWYSPDDFIDLGAVGGYFRSEALDVNDHGVVVGTVDLAGGGIPLAFVWNSKDGLQELGRADIFCISESGQILGRNGNTTIVWTPVPEPTSFAALAMGLVPVGLAAVRRRRRS